MMQIVKMNLKYIKMKKNITLLVCMIFFIGLNAQESTQIDSEIQKRIKIDGVAVVVGKNVVLDSDIDKYKKELELRSERELDISSCEILEEIMNQKLIAHHAVVDSIVASEPEVNDRVERNLSYFQQQLGSMERVVSMYGFNDEEDLRKELYTIQEEQLLIEKEKASIIEKVDVTPEEVRTYFKSLEDGGNLPEFSAEIELAQIVKIVKPSEEEVKRVVDKLTKIKEEIENGFSFRLKAIINSEDPAVSGSGPGSGGKYTITRESNFIKEFKEVGFSLEEGEISEPFASGYGYHIVKVDKIRGQERDVSHILMSLKISDEEMQASQDELRDIREKIINKEITFEDAVLAHSEDKDTRNNKGVLINNQTNDTHFDLTLLGADLYGRVNDLKANEITEPFFEEQVGEPKKFKIMLMKSKVEGHTANFTKDYEKIQKLALQKKEQETIDKWLKEKIVDTYVKLNMAHKKCEFNSNWKKD
jgi:peptidyl-prolyl cis-trans isomerase SurA